MEKVAKAIEKDGIQAWFDLDAKDVIGADADQYNKVTDVLDVWFDSGSSFFHVLQQDDQLTYPADMYLEGSDQHRGWFHSSILTSVAINRIAPYKQVLTHGFVVDEKGRKMSKSIGNVIKPQDLMKTMGADIVRLWVCSADYSGEMSVSKEILARMADSYRRIRNTARYLLSATNDFNPQTDMVSPNDMLSIDRWAVDRALQVQLDIKDAYDAYQFHAVYQRIHNFCGVEMSSFYLDIIKDRQYTMPADSRGRRSAQTAMFLITEALVRWIAPVLTFTSQEIWEQMPGQRGKMVFTELYFEGLDAIEPSSKPSKNDWDTIVEVRNAVTKSLETLRADGVIGGGLDANVTLYCDDKLTRILSELGDELRFVFITSNASVASLSDRPDSSEVIKVLDAELAITAEQSTAEKCERCWHRREDVGSDSTHPTLCTRCTGNISGNSEVRQYA